MDAERRLIIWFIGAAALIGLIAVVVLVVLRREVPDAVQLVTTGSLSLLAPSPLSKSTTPPDPPKPPEPHGA